MFFRFITYIPIKIPSASKAMPSHRPSTPVQPIFPNTPPRQKQESAVPRYATELRIPDAVPIQSYFLKPSGKILIKIKFTAYIHVVTTTINAKDK